MQCPNPIANSGQLSVFLFVFFKLQCRGKNDWGFATHLTKKARQMRQHLPRRRRDRTLKTTTPKHTRNSLHGLGLCLLETTFALAFLQQASCRRLGKREDMEKKEEFYIEIFRICIGINMMDPKLKTLNRNVCQNQAKIYIIWSCDPFFRASICFTPLTCLNFDTLGLHTLRSSCSFTWPKRVRTLQVIPFISNLYRAYMGLHY